MVVEKSKESDHYEQQLFCCQKKLDMALGHNDELKTVITELEHIKNYQESCLLNEEHMDYCQQEIEYCKGNLLLMSEFLYKKRTIHQIRDELLRTRTLQAWKCKCKMQEDPLHRKKPSCPRFKVQY